MLKIKKILLPIIGSLIVLISCDNSNQKKDKANNTNTSNSKELQKFKIVYNVAMNEEQSDYDVWIVDPETKEKRNITNNKNDVAWSYNSNDKIYFTSDRDTCQRCMYLYEMNSDGGDIKKVTDFQLQDSWFGFRKGGNEIIVKPSSKVDSVFYIIDKNGKILNKVSTGLTYSADPSFSPDGTKIVFRGGKQKSKRVEGFDEAIYVMDDNGKNLKRITNYPVNDTTAPWFAYKAGPPKWHPTDNFISFMSFQNGKYSLYAVTTDGKKQWKLTDNQGAEGYHSWSPDGKLLAFELTDSQETQFDIALMDWKTKRVEILTDSTYTYEQAPSFVILKQ